MDFFRLMQSSQILRAPRRVTILQHRAFTNPGPGNNGYTASEARQHVNRTVYEADPGHRRLKRPVSHAAFSSNVIGLSQTTPAGRQMSGWTTCNGQLQSAHPPSWAAHLSEESNSHQVQRSTAALDTLSI
jgi:hypothetical protein